MSQLKLTDNLALEQQELSRLIIFLQDEGIKGNLLRNAVNFGIVRNNTKTDISAFRVTIDDLSAKTIKIAEGYAYDRFGNLLHQYDKSGISLPDLNAWYWVRVRHKYSTIEKGTLIVSANGTVIGNGTEFTKVLRGQPNHASVIKLYQADGITPATLNGNDEHTILDVVSDTEIILSSVGLQDEVALKYSVIGTFTPGYVPSPSQKEIFQYDDCELSLVAETTLNTPPFGSGELESDTFFVARVKKTSTQLFVEDKRTQFFETKADFLLRNTPQTGNPLIGVEALKWESGIGTQEENLMFISWAFKSKDYSWDAANNQITINVGYGGRYVSTQDVQEGDFTGWRLYIEKLYVDKFNGYLTITDCVKPTPTTVRLTIAVMDTDFLALVDSTLQEIVIVPDADEIIIRPEPHEAGVYRNVGNNRCTFPINQKEARVGLPLYDAPYQQYQILYRYRTQGNYTKWNFLPDSIHGYYNEEQFDDFGELNVSPVPVRTPYGASLIQFTRSPKSYSAFKDRVDTGEIFGVKHTSIDNAVPLRTLKAGTDKQYQVFEGDDVSLQADNIINLSSIAKEGNAFYLHFRQKVNESNFRLVIVQGYVNTTSIGTVIREFSKFDYYLAGSAEGLLLKLVFDGSTWLLEEEYKGKNSLAAIDKDLNSIKSAGKYFVSISGTPTDVDYTASGYPVSSPGFLEVIASTESPLEYDNPVYVAQFFTSTTNLKFFRVFASSAWSIWSKVATQLQVDSIENFQKAASLIAPKKYGDIAFVDLKNDATSASSKTYNIGEWLKVSDFLDASVTGAFKVGVMFKSFFAVGNDSNGVADDIVIDYKFYQRAVGSSDSGTATVPTQKKVTGQYGNTEMIEVYHEEYVILDPSQEYLFEVAANTTAGGNSKYSNQYRIEIIKINISKS